MNTWKKARMSGLLVLLMLPLFSSCLDNDDRMPPTPVSFVSFFHGAPNTTSLTIEVDNRTYNTNTFDYGTYFDYHNFYTGERNFSFKALNTSNSLFDTTVTFVADKAYSFFLGEDGDSFEPIMVEDKLKNPGEGKALIRMVHLSPDTPEVNLQLGEEEEFLLEGMEYRDVTEFASVDAATVSFQIKTNEEEEAIVSANNIQLREGRIYTLVVRGYASASTGSNNALSIQVIRNYPSY